MENARAGPTQGDARTPIADAAQLITDLVEVSPARAPSPSWLGVVLLIFCHAQD